MKESASQTPWIRRWQVTQELWYLWRQVHSSARDRWRIVKIWTKKPMKSVSAVTPQPLRLFSFMPTTYLFFLLNVGVKRRCCRRVEVFLFIQENRIFIFLMVNVTFTNNFSDLKKAGDDDAFWTINFCEIGVVLFGYLWILKRGAMEVEKPLSRGILGRNHFRIALKILGITLNFVFVPMGK
jgi:hypothetical protein